LRAPACTVAFANQHYGDASKKGVLPLDRIQVHIMDDERELHDSVGPYGKSLLYLVSRALETVHKTPLLGLANAWDPRQNATDMWDPDTVQDVEAWQQLVAGKLKAIRYDKAHRVNDGVAMIPLAHGSFDNDLDVVTSTLERELRKKPLPTKVEIPHGF
jgi:hypothetical protein